MRRSDQPSRPNAMTCCRFSSLKTFTLTKGNPSATVNVLLQPHWPVFSRPSLAGFECPPRPPQSKESTKELASLFSELTNGCDPETLPVAAHLNAQTEIVKRN